MQMMLKDCRSIPFFLFRTFPAVSGSGARRQCPEAEFKCGARRRHSGQSLVAGARGSRYWYEIRAGAVPRDVPSAGLAQTRGLPPKHAPGGHQSELGRPPASFPMAASAPGGNSTPGGPHFANSTPGGSHFVNSTPGGDPILLTAPRGAV